MSWFSSIEERPSAANGSIRLTRWLGEANVSVKGCGQTSPYTNAMWKDALARAAALQPGARRVLMLGLGGGGAVPLIYKQFPGAELTAVEYDPEMVLIARELGYHGKYPFPAVVLGDAAEVVPRLPSGFDLVVVDLFDGPEPSALIASEPFFRALQTLLAPDGVLLCNVNRRPEYLDTPRALFNRQSRWSFRQNHLGLFWRVPAGYLPPEAWPEFGYSALPRGICKREEVGSNPKGIRWGLGPIIFEEYTGDAEPDLAESSRGDLARSRCIIWQRVARTDAPRGWHRLSRLPWRVDGYHELRPGYTERWHPSARRKLRIWREKHLDKTHEIVDLTFAQYAEAYRRSTIARKYGLHLLEVLERKLALPSGTHIALWGVRDIASGRIIAGTGMLYSPTHSSSVREAPFILEEARPCHAMTGLMDHWFARSLAQGVQLLVFTHFKQKGDPKDWAGFSDFKSHFVTGFVRNPPALYRLRGGKLF